MAYQKDNRGGNKKGGFSSKSFSNGKGKTSGGFSRNSGSSSYGEPKGTGGYTGYGSKPSGAGSRTGGGYSNNSDRLSYGSRSEGTGNTGYGSRSRSDGSRNTSGSQTGFSGRPSGPRSAGASGSSYGARSNNAGARTSGYNNDRPNYEGSRSSNSDRPSYGPRPNNAAPRNTNGGYAGNNNNRPNSEGQRGASSDRPSYGIRPNQGGGYQKRDSGNYNRPDQQERFTRGENRGYEQRNPSYRNQPPQRDLFVKPNPDQSDAKTQQFAIYNQNQPTPPAEETEDENSLPIMIYGRNPVREAIKSGRSIDKILVVDTGSEDGSLREIIHMAKERNLVIIPVSKAKLDVLALPYGYGNKPANHQGIMAQMPEVEYVEIADILQIAADKNEKPFVLVLDSLSDPHNLGAILRTAECAGVHGVIIPKRRAVSITPAVAKSSAGAVMHIAISRVPNLSAAVEQIKKEGLFVIGAEAGEQDMRKARLDGAIALVIGSEGQGISQGLREHCDMLVSIPMFGEINSLNASNAAAILIYEKLRQDER